jgi:RND family efflux transporter MFP subunit
MNKEIIFKYLIPAIAAILLLKALVGIFNNPKRQEKEPVVANSISAFEKSISGLGIAEPQSEIIAIGVDISGLVSQVLVEAGQKVEAGQVLFILDERQAKANFQLAQANLKAAEFELKQKQEEAQMYEKLKNSGAYSRDELNKKQIAAQIAEQNFEQAKAQSEIAKVSLEKLTIKAPIAGEILKVNVRLGEFAQAGVLQNALMTIGDVSKMHIRVEIDESLAHLFSKENEAVAYLRGAPEIAIPLEFVRIEPYIVGKVSLSGIGQEKVDTRVLQVIYAFENQEKFKVFVGSQLDVYIKK